MLFTDKLKQVVEEPRLMIDYFAGTYRRIMSEGKLSKITKYLIRKKFRVEAEKRKTLAKPCYDNGECFECGCATPDLFYIKRGCKKEKNKCYGPMG